MLMENINLLFRNIELRIIDGFPIEEPFKAVHMIQDPIDSTDEEYISESEGHHFGRAIAEAKEIYSLELALVNLKSFKKLTETQRDRLKKIYLDQDYKFNAVEGNPSFEGGGFYGKLIILI